VENRCLEFFTLRLNTFSDELLALKRQLEAERQAREKAQLELEHYKKHHHHHKSHKSHKKRKHSGDDDDEEEEVECK
jgi:hypothetical protein